VSEIAVDADPAAALPRQTSTQQARDFIRSAIVNGRLREGEAISQVKLALEIGVSRTPLREAIRMLEAEGWLESEPNRRVRVARISLRGFEQLYAMRITLEAFAVAVAVPRLTADDLARARELVARGHEDLRHGAYDDWERTNREFHSGLIRPAGESILQTCQALIDACWRYRMIYVLAQPAAFLNADDEHAAIVDACESLDAPRAASCVARHLARTSLILMTAADPAYDPVMIRTAMRQHTRNDEQNAI
jgi:DNA-binding GntR family transcriptional regulator